MKKLTFCTIIFFLIISLVGVLPAAAAATYTCKDLIGPEGTSVFSANGINDAGQVVGKAYFPPAGVHAFLYSDGVLQDLGTLPTPYDYSSTPRSLNATGQVAGNSATNGNAVHACLWSGGVVEDLGTLPGGGPTSIAYSINAAGQAVGYAYNSSLNPAAFLYSGGVMHDLNTLATNLPPQVTLTSASWINDQGTVAGYALNGLGPNSAFLYNGGSVQILGIDFEPSAINNLDQMAGKINYINPHAGFYSSNGGLQDLGTLPAPYNYFSAAEGINDAGQVVGSSYNISYDSHAFLYSGGVMYDLNSLVKDLPEYVYLQDAAGINNQGQIIANYGSGAYILTPITPVPGIDMLLQ